MSTQLLFPFLLAILNAPLVAQLTWTNYTNDRLISDVLFTNNHLWVASQGGLTRTHLITGDFQTYLAGNSPIVGGGMTEIEKAPDGSIWFGSENGGLFHLQNGVWTHYYDGIVTDEYQAINHLQVLPNGDTWFCVTKRGTQETNRLLRIRNGELAEFENLPDKQRDMYVQDTHFIYIVHLNNIYQYDIHAEEVVSVLNAENSILTADEKIGAILGDRDGNLIIPTQERILQLRNGSLSELSGLGLSVIKSFTDSAGNVYFQPPTGNPGNLRLVKYNGLQVRYMYDADFSPYPFPMTSLSTPIFVGADGQGRLFASLFNVDSEFTLFMFDETGWTPVKSQIYPLLDVYQSDVEADCHGHMWFSSRNGVDVRYADGSWGNFTVPVPQFHYFHANSMTVDPTTCSVWFPNESNSGHASTPGLIRISDGEVTSFLPGHDNVVAEATVDGTVYFLSRGYVWGHIKEDQITFLTYPDELTSVHAMDSDSKNVLYMAAWNEKIYRYDGVSLTRLTPVAGGEYVFWVYVDNADRLWAVTSNGLMMYDGIQWTDYGQTWPSGTVNGMAQDWKGNYWISTWNDGLFYWDMESIQQYTLLNSGLSSDHLRNVSFDPDGNLIVSQHIGATVLHIPETFGAHMGRGRVFYDDDKDGVYTPPTDLPAPRQKIVDNTRNAWSVTNNEGMYGFHADAPGTFTLQHHLPPGVESTTPNPREAELSGTGATLPAFGFWKLIAPDVEISLVNTMPVCNWELRVQVDVRNLDVYPTTGSLEIRFPGFFTFLESSLPMALAAPGILRIDALTLEALDIQNIRLTFANPGVEEVGNAFTLECLFQTETGQFTGTSIDTLRCAYDPNDKKVEPTGAHIGDYSLFADPVKYTIRFQNEGNFKAFDVVLIDTLDSRFDPATFELLSASHDVETHISGEGVVTFLFSDIDLPPKSEDEPGSQGHVSFSVQPHKHLGGHEQISNTASIYFDFNPPIVTNTTRWNFVDHLNTVSTQEAESHFALFPNPTSGLVYIDLEEAADYQLWDSAGRLITSGTLLAGRQDVRLHVGPGMYVFRLKNAVGGWAARKFIVL